jgi:hypothetical protein
VAGKGAVGEVATTERTLTAPCAVNMRRAMPARRSEPPRHPHGRRAVFPIA